jgi:dimethylargininase
MLLALTHVVSPHIDRCELSFSERTPIHYETARQQHGRYVDLLRELGVEIRELSVNVDYPDACFIEDVAIVVDELAVIARMGVPSRRGEPLMIAAELARYRPLVAIEPPGTLEGGDVLRIGRDLYVGLSPRTNEAGAAALAARLEPLGYRVHTVRISGCLHLKSAVTALDEHTILANPAWLDLSRFEDMRIVTVAAAEPVAANALRLGDAVILPGQYPRTAAKIAKIGYRVCALDLSEIIKAEAGVTCCSIILNKTA